MALREIRKHLKKQRRAETFMFTEQDMADLLGVSLNTYRSYEANPSKLTYEQAMKLANALLCDPKELF